MARNKNNGEVENETEQAPATEQAATETATPEVTTETPIDLSNFTSAVEAASQVGEANKGVLSDEDVTEVNKAYAELEGNKAKAAARAFLKDEMSKAVDDLVMVRAKTMKGLHDKLSATATKAKKTTAAAKAPADPTEAFVNQKVTLDLARSILIVPENVAADHEAKADALFQETYAGAQAYLAYLAGGKEGDEPEVSDLAKTSAKLASAKGARKASSTGGGTRSSYNGPRRSVKAHIQEAFADKPVGTFLKIGEIKSFRSSVYGDDSPSAGAVSAALASKTLAEDLPGIESASGDNGNGAKKVA